MFCDRCGTKLDDIHNFCSNCGKPIKASPLMPVQGRIVGHLRLLGIFWLAYSAFHLLPGLFLLAIFRPHVWFPQHYDMPPFVPGLLQFIGVLFFIGAALGIIAAWGLLARQPWARMLAIVLGCVSLLNFPFGTALGIYTLWVLLPAESEQEYRQMARAA